MDGLSQIEYIQHLEEKVSQLRKVADTYLKAREILENEYDICLECLDAKLEGHSSCGDCSCEN
jgi:hypothetical protein